MITRTIQTTVVKVAKIMVVDGKIESEPLPDVTIIEQNPKDSKIKKLIKETYPGDEVYILGKEVSEEIRGMSIDDFIKYSTVVTRPESQNKKGNN